MFQPFVGSLPIGKEFTGLSIRDPFLIFHNLELLDREYNPNRALAEHIRVEEICAKNNAKTPYYYPSYAIRGNYINGNQFTQIFELDPFGKHLLCFTGRPLGDDNPRFRLENTLYRYFWQDNRVGYLTQIIEATPENDYLYFEKYHTT